jgi:hypothetical protein
MNGPAENAATIASVNWTGMLEAEKSFRRLNGHKQLPTLRAALLRHEPLLLGDKLIFPQKNLAA